MNKPSANVELRCHACKATTSVRYSGHADLVTKLTKRKWSISLGAIACPDHRHVTRLARHRHYGIAL